MCSCCCSSSFNWVCSWQTFRRSAGSYLASRIFLRRSAESSTDSGSGTKKLSSSLAPPSFIGMEIPSHSTVWLVKSNLNPRSARMSRPIIMSYAPKVLVTCKSHWMTRSSWNSGIINVPWHFVLVLSSPAGVVHMVLAPPSFFMRNFLACLCSTKVPEAPVSRRQRRVMGLAFPCLELNLT